MTALYVHGRLTLPAGAFLAAYDNHVAHRLCVKRRTARGVLEFGQFVRRFHLVLLSRSGPLLHLDEREAVEKADTRRSAAG